MPSTTILIVEAAGEFLAMKLGIKIVPVLDQGLSYAWNGTNSKDRIEKKSVFEGDV